MVPGIVAAFTASSSVLRKEKEKSEREREKEREEKNEK